MILITLGCHGFCYSLKCHRDECRGTTWRCFSLCVITKGNSCHNIHPHDTLNNRFSWFLLFCKVSSCWMSWHHLMELLSLYCNHLLCFVCLRPIAATTFIQATLSKMMFHSFCYYVKCHRAECRGTMLQCYSTLCYKHLLFVYAWGQFIQITLSTTAFTIL